MKKRNRLTQYVRIPLPFHPVPTLAYQKSQFMNHDRMAKLETGSTSIVVSNSSNDLGMYFVPWSLCKFSIQPPMLETTLPLTILLTAE
jgi:hypothetical protein